MSYKIETHEVRDAPVIKLKCPCCGHDGTFEKIKVPDLLSKSRYFGQRRCPNDECKAHIFFIYYCYQKREYLITFPSQRIDFDKEGIPENVLSAFKEAIECHANKCYVATGIMIRKTLEEICEEQKAEGENLKERIKKLGAKIVIPKELITGMDDLRLLGNDAAHIKSKTFDQVSNKEVEIAAEFTKEILKAVYQYEYLLKRLQSLKNPQQSSSS